MRERVTAFGHQHVSAAHTSTLELTSDDWLTPAGDCIVGIRADRTPADFDERFVNACQDVEARITLSLTVGEESDHVVGRGDPRLTFESDRSLVCRTSTYVDDRTVFLEADGAAATLDRALIDRLQAGAELHAELAVDPAGSDDTDGGDRINHDDPSRM